MSTEEHKQKTTDTKAEKSQRNINTIWYKRKRVTHI